MSDDRREFRKHVLRSVFEQSLDERVDRYLSVSHQWVTGDSHFALASAECIELYQDGYFTSCIMVSQSVGEGILKFVALRNGIEPSNYKSRQELATYLVQSRVISQDFADAFIRIWESYRNDFHHMNPPVSGVPLEATAMSNVLDLSVIEREIFECRPGPNGSIVPVNRIYWDVAPDGSVPVFLRLG